MDNDMNRRGFLRASIIALPFIGKEMARPPRPDPEPQEELHPGNDAATNDAIIAQMIASGETLTFPASGVYKVGEIDFNQPFQIVNFNGSTLQPTIGSGIRFSADSMTIQNLSVATAEAIGGCAVTITGRHNDFRSVRMELNNHVDYGIYFADDAFMNAISFGRIRGHSGVDKRGVGLYLGERAHLFSADKLTIDHFAYGVLMRGVDVPSFTSCNMQNFTYSAMRLAPQAGGTNEVRGLNVIGFYSERAETTPYTVSLESGDLRGGVIQGQFTANSGIFKIDGMRVMNLTVMGCYGRVPHVWNVVNPNGFGEIIDFNNDWGGSTWAIGDVSRLTKIETGNAGRAIDFSARDGISVNEQPLL